jgi:hypothetical protein
MTRPELAIRCRPADIAAYKRILAGKWSTAAFDESVALVRRLAGMPERSFDGEESSSQRRRATVAKAGALHPIPSDAPEHLWEYLESLNPLLPTGPAALPAPARAGQARLWSRARELAVLLSVEHWAVPTGEAGFFLDARSLALQLALEFLVPKLDEQGMTDEKDHFLSAAWAHALVAWQAEPSHQSYLQAGILAVAGRSEDAARRYLQALKLCPRDSHEFLTLAHAYWFHLLDAGDVAKGEAFLFALHRSVREEDAPEVEEMIRTHHRASSAA